MIKVKGKNAITLIALVITIVIMLLLAAIVIQMAIGENGLFVKTIQAKKEQEKAELYDTAKLSYANLKVKALENGQPEPQVELALSTIEFRDKYNIVGDDITDKKGEKIDTKENVLKAITGTTSSGSISTSPGGSSTETGTAIPEESTPKPPWNKEVGGVRIEEKDKDSTVIKLKVPREKAIITFRGEFEVNGVKKTNGFGKEEEFAVGEYIVKSKEMNGFSILNNRNADFEIEILQWGKESEYEIYIFELHNVTKIYEPEPDKVSVQYVNGKFTEIPEWIFSKKKTSKKMSSFKRCEKITSIPENLFKNNIEAEEFVDTFAGCKNITTIPENLFKHNTKATRFDFTFAGCEKITSIPENLFTHNVEVQSFRSAFANCHSIINIPEKLFRHNSEARTFEGVFGNCINLKNIPEDLFRYNILAGDFSRAFSGTSITNIPENLFKYNTKAETFSGTFDRCINLINIPENLFKYNIEAEKFDNIFSYCTKLVQIPENLFRYNTKINNFYSAFIYCSKINNIPNNIITKAKVVKENGGDVGSMFFGCSNATNYNSLPGYMR